ncbi:MAG: nitrite/sulfite reductase [Candidatus Bathyarchaeia archaeon]
MTDTDLDSLESFVGRYSLGYEGGEGSQHFLRVKIPNGIISSTQLRGIAQLSDRLGRGYAELTDRQDIQLHWIRDEDAIEAFSQLRELGFTTDMCGQGYPEARYGDVRNIVGCPVAGLAQDELIDASPLVLQMTRFYSGNRDFLDLPRKFKISLSGCAVNCVKPEIHDLSFVAVRKPEGKVGFTAFVGGGLGSPPMMAKPLGVFLKPSEVFEVARAVIELFRDYGSRETKPRARFKWMVEAWGIDRLRGAVEEKLGRSLEPITLDAWVSGCDHSGLQAQKQPGRFYVALPILGGILPSGRMRTVADLADKYGSGELRLSTSQKPIIVNIPEEHVPSLLTELEALGFSLNTSSLRWRTIACAGNFCGKALDHVKARAVQLVEHLESHLGEDLRRLDVTVYLSGCPNGCGHHPVAGIGLQSIQLKVGDELRPGYNIYLGGRLGPRAAFGRLVKQRVEADQVKLLVENILKAFLRRRRDGESFSDYCERHCVEELEALIEQPFAVEESLSARRDALRP